MATTATKDRILDAAESLFASGGFAGTSLRTLTRAAGVNLAAVHYHFGSKEAVLRAVLHRIIDPINLERLRRLDAIEARAGGHGPAVEALLEAFVAPPLEHVGALGERGAIVMRFVGRTHHEPTELVRAMVREHFEVVALRFTAAMARSLPELPRAEIAWRLHCVVGLLSFELAQTSTHVVLPGFVEQRDVDGAVHRLVRFLSAGVRAPHDAAPRRAPAGRAPRHGRRQAPR